MTHWYSGQSPHFPKALCDLIPVYTQILSLVCLGYLSRILSFLLLSSAALQAIHLI